ncbi:hypothetical protein ADK90_15580 [Streptomyces sp. XY413]|nr:hypothetical protein ADK90_15580 [Streptomyces sp. XY413]
MVICRRPDVAASTSTAAATRAARPRAWVSTGPAVSRTPVGTLAPTRVDRSSAGPSSATAAAATRAPPSAAAKVCGRVSARISATPCRRRRPIVRSRASSAARSGTLRISVSSTASSAKPAAPATEAQKRRSADRWRGSEPSSATASALVRTGYTSSAGCVPGAGAAGEGASEADAAGRAERTSARSRSPSTDPRPNHRLGRSAPLMRAAARLTGRTTVAASPAGTAGVQSMTAAPRTRTSPPLPGWSVKVPEPPSRATPELNSAGTGASAGSPPGVASRAGSKGPQPRTRDSSAYAAASTTIRLTWLERWTVPTRAESWSIHSGTDVRTPGSSPAAFARPSGSSALPKAEIAASPPTVSRATPSRFASTDCRTAAPNPPVVMARSRATIGRTEGPERPVARTPEPRAARASPRKPTSPERRPAARANHPVTTGCTRASSSAPHSASSSGDATSSGSGSLPAGATPRRRTSSTAAAVAVRTSSSATGRRQRPAGRGGVSSTAARTGKASSASSATVAAETSAGASRGVGSRSTASAVAAAAAGRTVTAPSPRSRPTMAEREPPRASIRRSSASRRSAASAPARQRTTKATPPTPAGPISASGAAACLRSWACSKSSGSHEVVRIRSRRVSKEMAAAVGPAT